MMKKQYITPETEIFNLQIEGALLAGSVFEPTIWTGGGGADSRLLGDEGMDILTGDSDLEILF